MPYKDPEDTKKYRKAYYWKNKERAREYARQWYIENPEYIRQYYKTHLEDRERWYIAHPGYKERHNRQYRSTHLLQSLEDSKQYRKTHPEKMRELKGKRKHLGFEPLNNYFDGSEAHHLDDTYVVYIPKEIHQSIFHCLKTGQNMLEINSYAMNYILMTKEVG